jgi:TetR/AcrR family transcriptional repressor of lmrAB and yxaGH operons
MKTLLDKSPRDRLIRASADLFQVQGYNGTGLNQILQQSGAPKGSLYHYFPGGKEDLAVAAIEHAGAEIAAVLPQLLAGKSGLPAALGAVINFFIGQLESSQFKKGCPIATIALEQAADSAKIQTACELVYASWRLDIEGLLSAHGATDPAAAAWTLLAALEGALILSRALRNCAPLRQLVQDLPILLQLAEA